MVPLPRQCVGTTTRRYKAAPSSMPAEACSMLHGSGMVRWISSRSWAFGLEGLKETCIPSQVGFKEELGSSQVTANGGQGPAPQLALEAAVVQDADRWVGWGVAHVHRLPHTAPARTLPPRRLSPLAHSPPSPHSPHSPAWQPRARRVRRGGLHMRAPGAQLGLPTACLSPPPLRRLDAIGAIGVARCLTFGGAKHRVLYDAAVPPRVGLTKQQYMEGAGGCGCTWAAQPACEGVCRALPRAVRHLVVVLADRQRGLEGRTVAAALRQREHAALWAPLRPATRRRGAGHHHKPLLRKAPATQGRGEGPRVLQGEHGIRGAGEPRGWASRGQVAPADTPAAWLPRRTS
jgi:hypothetical protein